MASEPITVKGVILSSVPFKEKDRLVTIISADRGIVEFCAKGAQKAGSRNSCVSMPFTIASFVLSLSNGYYYLKEVSLIESDSGIYSDLDRIEVASHISRIIMGSVYQSENSREAYELTVYSMYALSTLKDPCHIVYSAFNWRYMSILGLVPKFDADPEGTYSVDLLGGMISDVKGAYKVSGKILLFLNECSDISLDRLFTRKMPEGRRYETCEFTRAYMSVRFEKELKKVLTTE